MASFQDLEAQNPDIKQQYDEWRNARAANKEDPWNYEAFRQHLVALGAPDPGPEPISDGYWA